MGAAPPPLFADVSLSGAIISTLWWLVTGFTLVLVTIGAGFVLGRRRQELGKSLLLLAAVLLVLGLALLVVGLRIDVVK
jgi:hypothetical protein